jgi:hypothetical protein
MYEIAAKFLMPARQVKFEGGLKRRRMPVPTACR